MAYCFRILERTARGHLVPGDYVDDRTNKDRRPLMQVGIIFVLMLFAIAVGIFMGKIAGQIALIVVALALPASIMVLALDERFFAAINPVRLLEVVAGIGLPCIERAIEGWRKDVRPVRRRLGLECARRIRRFERR